MAPKSKKSDETEATVGTNELAQALILAINQTKPKGKVALHEHKKNTPWSPKNGEARVKFKRKMYHHGIPVGERVTNEDITLMNQLKPGLYFNGFVKINKRRDKGLDIDYPIKTSAQRLRLINDFGITSFTQLLHRLVDESANPVKYKTIEELDD